MLANRAEQRRTEMNRGESKQTAINFFCFSKILIDFLDNLKLNGLGVPACVYFR